MQATFGARHHQIAAIICDMDNTLFDFVAAKREACRCVVEFVGAGDGEELFMYFLRGIHGFEHHDNIRDYLVSLDAFHPRTFDACCRIYEETKLHLIEPYPGVHETLNRLQDAGICLAVATDAALSQAQRRLSRAGLADFFEIVVTPEVSGKRKPEPDSFLFALNRFRVRPQQALMVGDSPGRDIAPSRKLGMLTAFAAYGDWRSGGTDDAGADIVLRQFSDLLAHLELTPKDGQ